MKCEVVRDLIPLVIDDVASEESRNLVGEHLETCEACRAYRDGMAAQLEKPAPVEDDTSFIRFCRRLQKNFRWRRLALWVLIAALAVGAAVFGVRTVYDNIYVSHKMIPLENVDARLCRLDDGQIMVEFTMLNGQKWYGAAMDSFQNGVYCIEPWMPVWPLGDYGDWSGQRLHSVDLSLSGDGTLVYRNTHAAMEYDSDAGAMVEKIVIDGEEPVQAVWLGNEHSGGSRVIYRPGDEIPLYDGPSDAIPREGING